MPEWNWQKIKQNKNHPGAELLLFENYLLSSSKLLAKNSRRYSKKKIQKSSVSVLMRLLMAIKLRLKMKNRPHIYNINGARPRHGHKYTKYKI